MTNTTTMVMGGSKTNSMKRVNRVIIDLSNYRFDKLPKLSRKGNRQVAIAK